MHNERNEHTDEVPVEAVFDDPRSQVFVKGTVTREQLEVDIATLREALATATGAKYELLKRRLDKLENHHVYMANTIEVPTVKPEADEDLSPTFNLLDSPRLTTHLNQAGFPDESIKDNWIDEFGFVWEIGIADDGIAYTWCVNWSPVRT